MKISVTRINNDLETEKPRGVALETGTILRRLQDPHSYSTEGFLTSSNTPLKLLNFKILLPSVEKSIRILTTKRRRGSGGGNICVSVLGVGGAGCQPALSIKHMYEYISSTISPSLRSVKLGLVAFEIRIRGDIYVYITKRF